jgi:hypothetical protein
MSNDSGTPKVFISYSWSSEEHEAWVLELAARLVGDGVDVVLDKWELKEGHDKYAFMERMVNDPTVDRVLVICDRIYSEKADGRRGGVGTETQIISPEIYAEVQQDKFLPIVTELDAEGDPYRPAFLKGRIYIDMSAEEKVPSEYQRLIRSIFGRPLHKKPELGKPPAYLLEETIRRSATAHRLDLFKDAVLKERRHAHGLLADYFDAAAETLRSERISRELGGQPLDELVVQSLERLRPLRDELADLFRFLGRYDRTNQFTEDLQRGFQLLLAPRFEPLDSVRWEEGMDNLSFFLWEMFLHFTAIAIDTSRFDTLTALLDAQYFIPTERDAFRGPLRSFPIFEVAQRSLEINRKQRLDLRWLSVGSATLNERSQGGPVPFNHLVQADFVLAMRTVFVPVQNDHWWPRSLVYAEDLSTFDVFLRARSRVYFDKLKVVFAVDTAAELLARFERAAAEQRFPRVERVWGGFERYSQFMNLPNLATQ